MATETTPKPAASVPDAAKNNAEVAAKVAAQDISGQSTAGSDFREAVAALDDLAAQITAKPVEPVKPPEPAKPVEPVKPPEPPKPAAQAKPVEPPKPAAPTPDPAVQKQVDEIFKGSPSLPPNASPKSAEAFSSIKFKAVQEITERDKQIEALKKQIEDAKKPTPEQLQKEKELEEHRQWRVKMDVDFDPKFKEFDKTIAQHREFVYAQLSKSPKITPEIIEQIKKYGGPDMVKLDKLFESVGDPTLQRLVEAKVADIEMAKYQKEQAVKAAKDNLDGYLKERQTALTQATEGARQAVIMRTRDLLSQLPWFTEKKPAANAPDEEKKEAEDHNIFVKELQKQIVDATADDSPEMRAVLITGLAQLFNLQRVVPRLEAKLAAAEKELAEVRGKWEAVKQSGRSRLSESQAPAAGLPAAKPAGPDVMTRTSDALDNIAKDIVEKRAQAGNA